MSPADAAAPAADATAQTYTGLSGAFRYFNTRLFEGKLPIPLITLQRKNRMRGYYHEGIFKARGTTKEHFVDEIALNPTTFARRTDMEILSTLVHEMVHMQQHKFGKPSRNAYHDKEWGQMMEAVGLVPSSTGQPGGKRTGQRVTHYILAGGPFEIAALELIAGGWALAWEDVRGLAEGGPPVVALTSTGLPIALTTTGKAATGTPTIALTLIDGTQDDPLQAQDASGEPWKLDELPEAVRACAVDVQKPADPGEDQGEAPKMQTVMYKGRPLAIKLEQTRQVRSQSSGIRTKYVCPVCKAAVWGREGINLLCGDDGVAYASAAGRTTVDQRN